MNGWRTTSAPGLGRTLPPPDAPITPAAPAVVLPPQVVIATLTAGAPTTGEWKTGQACVDTNGVTWTCTAGGNPGTWARATATAGVNSFNTRTGNVLPVAGDYPGNFLGTQFYNPATVQDYAYAAGVWVYLDPTNLAVAFTAPKSGNVWIRAFGGLIQQNGPAEAAAGISTTDAGTPELIVNIGMIGNASTESGNDSPLHLSGPLTGLTPGNAYTAYLAISCSATNGTLYVGPPPSGGPIGITVEAM